MFGIDLAVSIMDGPDLSEKRRKELGPGAADGRNNRRRAVYGRVQLGHPNRGREGHGSRMQARLPGGRDLERNTTDFG